MRYWIMVVVGLLLAAPVTVTATTLSFDAKIRRTLASTDEKFGGCMVLLDVSPSGEGLSCNTGNNWVTFSCTGEHVSKSSALRMFDSAQMAFMTDRSVRVTIDDSRKHDGWCLVERIDVLAL